MRISFRCMVYGNPFYISVIVPVTAIILANIVILITVTMRLRKSRKHKPMSGAARLISEARIAFACNLLLGTTWVLAFFAVEEVTMLFQWLFCISNSLQGFFIFLFYTVRNQGVRNAWLKALGKDPSFKSSQLRTSQTKSSKGKCSKKFLIFNFFNVVY